MLSSQPGSAQAAAIRSIRRMVRICVILSAGGTVLMVYEFGFAARPHRHGLACILGASYLACSGAAVWLLHRGWTRRLRKM